MKIYIIFFITILTINSKIYSDEKILNEHIEKFFEIYQKKGIEFAIDYFFSLNPHLKNKSKELQQLKQEANNISRMVGKYIQYRVIHSNFVNDSIYLIVCSVNYEEQPLKFSFVFYKSRKDWISYRFEIDTNYPDKYLDTIIQNIN